MTFNVMYEPARAGGGLEKRWPLVVELLQEADTRAGSSSRYASAAWRWTRLFTRGELAPGPVQGWSSFSSPGAFSFQ